MNCQCHSYPTGLPNYKHLLKTSQLGFYKNLRPHLKLIEESPCPRPSIYQCQDCSRIWVKDWPQPEQLGGREPCYYVLDVADPEERLSSSLNLDSLTGFASKAYEAFAHERSEHLEKMFLRRLGPEVGPDKCNTEGCDRLVIKNSVKCKQHHSEMIKRLKQNNPQ